MAMRFIRTRGKLLGKVVRGIDINGNNIVDEVPNVVYDLEGRNCDCLTAGQMFAEITDNGNMVFIFSTCAIDNFPTALQLMHPNWVLISQTDRIARCNGYDYKLDKKYMDWVGDSRNVCLQQQRIYDPEEDDFEL